MNCDDWCGKWWGIAAILLVLSVTPCMAQGMAQSTAQGTAQDGPLQRRLAALQPADANGYLKLAEELIDEATAPGQIRLGRQLLVLAMQIGKESSDLQQRLAGRSAALLLASIATTESERRWVLSMAPLIAGDEIEGRLALGQGLTWDPNTGLLASEALGLSRSGDGRLALRRLDEPGVREVLTEVTPLLGISGAGGAAGQVERLARGWPCPQCSNQRVIRARDGAGGVESVRCPTCLGNPGARDMTTRELSQQLRAELRLLGGSLRSWSAQAELDAGAPLREASVSGLERFYRLDLQARVWRDGEWVRPDPPVIPEGDPAAAPDASPTPTLPVQSDQADQEPSQDD